MQSGFTSNSITYCKIRVNEAASIATGTVAGFLKENPDSFAVVVFVLFDDITFAAYRRALEAAGIKDAD